MILTELPPINIQYHNPQKETIREFFSKRGLEMEMIDQLKVDQEQKALVLY